jgi:hypothetical protein
MVTSALSPVEQAALGVNDYAGPRATDAGLFRLVGAVARAEIVAHVVQKLLKFVGTAVREIRHERHIPVEGDNPSAVLVSIRVGPIPLYLAHSDNSCYTYHATWVRIIGRAVARCT